MNWGELARRGWSLLRDGMGIDQWVVRNCVVQLLFLLGALSLSYYLPFHYHYYILLHYHDILLYFNYETILLTTHGFYLLPSLLILLQDEWAAGWYLVGLCMTEKWISIKLENFIFCPGSLSVGVCCLILHFWLFQHFRKWCANVSLLAVHHHALVTMEIEIISVTVVFSVWQLTWRPGGPRLAEDGLKETSSLTGRLAAGESWPAGEHPSATALVWAGVVAAAPLLLLSSLLEVTSPSGLLDEPFVRSFNPPAHSITVLY